MDMRDKRQYTRSRIGQHACTTTTGTNTETSTGACAYTAMDVHSEERKVAAQDAVAVKLLHAPQKLDALGAVEHALSQLCKWVREPVHGEGRHRGRV
jgi:hypothetical protein